MWDKTPVLCFIEVTLRKGGDTRKISDCIAVEVEFPSQIEHALIRRMAELSKGPHWAGLIVGWEWSGFLPKTMTPSFQPMGLEARAN